MRTGTLILGTLAAALAANMSMAQGYRPGDFQSSNANYPKRNPFYFEGRIDWDLLKIDQPSNAWEFAQRGIHKQDDLEDIDGAIADYRQSVSMNSLKDASCQLITAAPTGFGQAVDPPPCMITVRLRLANLLKTREPQSALDLLGEALKIDPLRLGVNALIGETYTAIAESAADSGEQADLLQDAISAYQAELALSPVTDLSKKLTGDEANNAHTHWVLAGIYRKLAQPVDEAAELDLYLKATNWHSDTYPWRISLAQKRLEQLRPSVRLSHPPGKSR